MRITMNYTKLKLIQLEQTVTKFKNQCFNQIYLHCFECSSQSRPIRTHTLDDGYQGRTLLPVLIDWFLLLTCDYA